MQIMKRSIIDDEELLRGAKAIAADLRVGAARRLKLAKIIDGHLDWFERARRRGLEWTDIVGILFEVGVARPDGRPLSRGHLSALVWRKLRSAGVPLTTVKAVPPTSRETIGSKPAVDGESDVPTSDARGENDLPLAHSASMTADDNNRGKQQGVTGQASARASVVAYMRRAARMKRDD